MDTLDIPSIRNEMREMARTEFEGSLMRTRASEVRRRLQEVHADEMNDAVQLILVYKMYRDLFAEEQAKKLPSIVEAQTYVVAMKLIAQRYVGLLT